MIRVVTLTTRRTPGTVWSRYSVTSSRAIVSGVTTGIAVDVQLRRSVSSSIFAVTRGDLSRPAHSPGPSRGHRRGLA